MTVTSTIGTASRNYSTLSGWAASLPATLADSYVGECYNDSQFSGDSPLLTLSGHTTTTTFTITLTTGPGQSFIDNANAATNPLRYNASNGVSINASASVGYAYAITGTDSNVNITKLQFMINSVHGGGISLGAGIATEQCIFETYTQDQNYTCIQGGSSSYYLVTNCLFITRAVTGNCIFFECSSNGSLANCTFVCPSDEDTVMNTGAAWINYSPGDLTNCAFFGLKSFSGTGSGYTFTNCMSDYSTAVPGVTIVSYANQFVNSLEASSDFRLKSGADCIDAGSTDTGDIPNSIDIIGTTRPQGTAWDVGCWEYVAPPPVFDVSASFGVTANYSEYWSLGAPTPVSISYNATAGFTATGSVIPPIFASASFDSSANISAIASQPPATVVTTFNVVNYNPTISGGTNLSATFGVTADSTTGMVAAKSPHSEYAVNANVSYAITANHSLSGIFSEDNSTSSSLIFEQTLFSGFATITGQTNFLTSLNVSHAAFPSFTVTSQKNNSVVKITPSEVSIDFDADIALLLVKEFSESVTLQSTDAVSASSAPDFIASAQFAYSAGISNQWYNAYLNVATFGINTSYTPQITVTDSRQSNFDVSSGVNLNNAQARSLALAFGSVSNAVALIVQQRSVSFEMPANVDETSTPAQTHTSDISISFDTNFNGIGASNPSGLATFSVESDSSVIQITDHAAYPVFAASAETTNATVWTRITGTVLNAASFINLTPAISFSKTVSHAVTSLFSSLYSSFVGAPLQGVTLVNESMSAPTISNETME